ncbi:MAG: hypothetical protein KGH93_02490 [Patescibacteria group bacterium]|nr:hypothetical protein [Patescibacteria group bacterium]MDE1946043.1 hypothetical protein [Patescibacteria group bacterium]
MKKISAIGAAALMPVTALAANLQYTGGGLGGLIVWFSGILTLVVPVLIALAVVWFIWNVFRYTIASNEEAKKEATSGIVWGIVGIFVMVAVWGLVGVLQNTFQLQNTVQTPVIPTVQ